MENVQKVKDINVLYHRQDTMQLCKVILAHFSHIRIISKGCAV
jgi:hypothetical protein